MSFLTDTKLQNGTVISDKINTNSFLGNITIPKDQTRANRLVEFKNEAKLAEEESKKANSFGGILKGTIKELSSKVVTASNVVVSTLWDTYEQTPYKIINDIQSGSEDFQKNNIIKGTLKSGGRTAADVVILLFAPISAAIAGILSLTNGDKLIDQAGQVIADKSGITDIQAFQKFAMKHPNAAEDFNRILMLFMARMETGKIEPKRILGEIKSFSQSIIDKAKPIIPKTETIIKSKIEPVIEEITPTQKHQDYAKKQGYEPYIPESQLPTIDFGKPIKDTLPSIQIGESIKITKSKSGEYTYEPIKESISQVTPQPEFVSRRPGGFIETVIPPKSKVFETKGTGEEITKSIKLDTPETKVSKLSKDIEQKLNEDWSNLPEYNTMNMADQAQRALKLIADNPVEAKSIAMGEKPAPNGTREGSVFVALRETAYKNNDVNMLLDLAHSKLANEASILGQRIKAYDAAKLSQDPVNIIKTIENTNKKQFELKNKKNYNQEKNNVVKDIESRIEKLSSNKQSWADFIESIKCK